MAANPMISPTRAKAMLDNLTGNFNSLYINIYTGALEATCGTSTSGTQLAALQFGATAFGASVDGASTGIMTATANAITSPVALANVHVGGTFVASALSIQNTAAAPFSAFALAAFSGFAFFSAAGFSSAAGAAPALAGFAGFFLFFAFRSRCIHIFSGFHF